MKVLLLIILAVVFFSGGDETQKKYNNYQITATCHEIVEDDKGFYHCIK